MVALRDAIAEAKQRQFARDLQRDNPDGYRRLCELGNVYPLLEFFTAREVTRLIFMRWYWRNGDNQ